MTMPYDIGNIVYYLKSDCQNFEIIKCYVYGYFNFGNGWKIRLHTNRNKYKYVEYDLPASDVGYTIFANKSQAEERIKELKGKRD